MDKRTSGLEGGIEDGVQKAFFLARSNSALAIGGLAEIIYWGCEPEYVSYLVQSELVGRRASSNQYVVTVRSRKMIRDIVRLCSKHSEDNSIGDDCDVILLSSDPTKSRALLSDRTV